MSLEVGSMFGKLTVISLHTAKRVSGKTKWMALCECECGEVIGVERHNLKNGNSSQCPPCATKTRGEKRKTHGSSFSRKDIDPVGHNCYTRWQSMKRRCYNPNENRYNRYGGRGIKVCDRWLNSYDNFLEDMGFPPNKSYQIDRIDNDGDYRPGNCRWVSRKKNGRNKCNNKIIEAFGERLTQAEWTERTGIKRETIAMRLKRGWSAEKALS